MRNAGLEEAQAGIKIARRNINNLRYADDTTLMSESEEELRETQKPLDESESGEWKVGLKLNIQKMKIMAHNTQNKTRESSRYIFTIFMILLYFFLIF